MAAAAEGREKGAGRERPRSAILLLLLILLLLPPPARPPTLPAPAPLRARATGRCHPCRGSLPACLPRVCPPETAEVFSAAAWCWGFLFSACRRGEGRWVGEKSGGPGGNPSGQGQRCLGRRRPFPKAIPGCSSRNGIMGCVVLS